MLYAYKQTKNFDFPYLMNLIRKYNSPKDKISSFLRKKEILKVKKGIYVLPEFKKFELLANQIYGPSYISNEFAMFHYGLIPEKVVEFTSVTIGKIKKFNTPVGRYSYRHLPLEKYNFEFTSENGYLIATPEKSICDFIYLNSIKSPFTTSKELNIYLRENMRIEKSSLKNLNPKLIRLISKKFNHLSIQNFSELISNLK